MIVSKEKCHVCGKEQEFVMGDDDTLLREARCSNCGASIRNSDTSAAILDFLGRGDKSFAELNEKDVAGKLILNTCSTGSIHNALKRFPTYVCSEYFTGVPCGEFYEGILSVDLSKIPFPDNSVDLIISEDVFEHVQDYQTAMSEILRVLKPGGEHIFTVPIHDGKKTASRIGKKNVFHGDPNPQSGGDGVIVFTDWGDDITDIVSGFGFETTLIRNHAFFMPEEVTDVDSDYEEYSKHLSELEKYFKYNSYVIRSKKPNSTEKVATLSDEWFSELALNKKILEKNEEIHALNDDNEARGKHIVKLDDEIKNYRDRVNQLMEECSVEQKHNVELIAQNEKYARQTDELIAQNENYAKQTAELRQTVINKEGHIEQLLEVEREYEREKNSREYKIAKGIRNVSKFIMPYNSKRRFFAKVILRCMRHPGFLLKALSPKRIKSFITTVRTDGMEAVNMRYKYVENDDDERVGKIDNSNLDLMPVNEKGKSRDITDYEKLVFAETDHPEVSIVIPVYNQFDYTYNCLNSILKHSGDVIYEIIIADDCSTDATKQIKEAVSGIKVSRNKENLRFLLNCNNAAKRAKGKYILFLNNDTQVQDNWLRPLVDIMSDEKVGMTGSKLVYSNGQLQEAGGILWKDGSAWNYGNKKDPEDPEFNYVKEVDYISGAAIMIRRKLWEEIGGFDERFAPAYYEDTDLAFEVRKHGYKVVYQPLSVVVHFEGVSNGTDTSSGQKAYQVTNAKKFFGKWKDVLEKENFPNAENVFLAKDRSRFKKHILVVDQYVPWHDQDAGCKCSYMYLKMFLKMGFKVTFIGDNFFKHEPYTTELNQLGIEVLYGNYYYNNWQKFLKENLKYFSYVYLQRPHISCKYIDLVKEYSHAKIIYFAHDLHHVREQREYEITGNVEKLESAKKWKEIEYDLFSKADVGYVVGSFEQGVMQKAFPGKPIRNIPLYIYDDVPEGIRKDFSERQDLMYVGGFGHPPNIDAVLWFGKEVMPLIVKKYPDIKWHVIGSKATDEVKALASRNIIVDGFLSDEDLAEMYKTCRIDIVPLRFGAGVKGKVVEAAYFQIPLVTTAIGAEGLDNEVGNMHVVDDAKEMAEYICSIYEDYDKLKEMSDAGAKFINKYFTSKCAEDILRLDISV